MFVYIIIMCLIFWDLVEFPLSNQLPNYNGYRANSGISYTRIITLPPGCLFTLFYASLTLIGFIKILNMIPNCIKCMWKIRKMKNHLIMKMFTILSIFYHYIYLSIFPIYKYIYIYIYIYICVYVCVCVCGYSCVCMCVCVYVISIS